VASDAEAPLAPLSEQHRIVSAIESYFTRLDDAVADAGAGAAQPEAVGPRCLKAAVEGRLVPTEAELARAEGRSYEPGLGVLTRIPRRTPPPLGGRGASEDDGQGPGAHG